MVTNYKYNTLNQIATFYDKPLLNAAGGNNLRNRIAAVAFYDQYMPDSLSYQTATHYSYDIHGNVKRLVQDIPALDSYSRKLTYIDYEYDLVSGNVNKVWFQKGKPEQFMHRYRYDADNRLTHVYTTNTISIMQVPGFAFPQKTIFHTQERLETRYFYLPNGMLSRMELGQKNVQGTDYAYTLQGWLKDINGYRTTPSGLLARHDIGFDGQFFETVDNSEFCRDAFSTMLQYHHDDFSPISGSNYYNRDYIHAVPLFNGNISALTTDYLTTGINPLVKFFRYDKLNRIKGMKTNSDAGNPQCQPFNTYSTYYTYDHNGNLDTLIRYDSETNELHYIEYEYLSGNNRLDSITAWWGLNTGGYRYDAIGNLARDNGEGLDISWNAAGKVDTIWKNGNVLSTFRYSATGQRQMKKTGNITDYYIHDASGNVMCIYRVSKHAFKAIERPIYGAKRLGELKQQVDLYSSETPSIPASTIGMRQYELTDHLGNVMATILDRRQPYSPGDYSYKPYIVSTTDYYPFGYPIPNRSTNTGGYRYFFNGQEGDNEVFGENSLFAFEYRMHDARLGRFWSVDPLAAKYPWNSTYAFTENRVIDGTDVEGLEYLNAYKSRFQFKQGGIHLKVSNFLWINRKRWEASSADPNHWTFNSETNQKDVGISTEVSSLDMMRHVPEIPLGSIDNTYGAVEPSYNPSQHQISNPKTKASNYTKTDKRYANRIVSGASSSTKMAARSILAVDILNTMAVQYIGIAAMYENKIIEDQWKYVKLVIKDMNEALNHQSEYIPDSYMNVQSITNIMNVMLQGENNTNDPMVEKIGKKIFDSISKKNIQNSKE